MNVWSTPDGTAHAKIRVQIHIGHAALGEFIFDPGDHPEMLWQRSSIAYFCRDCGEVWARLVFIEPVHGQMETFDAIHCACAAHPDPWNIPGSLLVGPLVGFLNYLPAKVLRRELEVHLNATSQGVSYEEDSLACNSA